jgi:NADH-quinone oxidoreductase subunit L
LAGFGLIPVVYLLTQGFRRGWFRRSAGDEHGGAHGDHGHGDDGHDGHGHGDHGHEEHGHGREAQHGSAAGGAAAHLAHAPALAPISLGGVVGMLVASVLVGGILQFVIPNSTLSLKNLLEQSRPAGTAADVAGVWVDWTWPNEHTAHLAENHARIAVPITLLATGTWIIGIGLATLMYGLGYLNPEDVRRQFAPIYRLLWNKWWFDELYDWLFVRPTLVLSRVASGIDRTWLDGIIDGCARLTRSFANAWDRIADRTIVDGSINLLASWTYSLGLTLREVQTGKLRQYVMFIVVGAIAIFVLISFFWNTTLAH